MGRTEHRARGHIEERANGAFRAIVFAGVDPVTGKKRYLKKSAPTRKQAKVEMTKLQNQVDERRHPRSAITVGKAIEQWLEATSHEASTRERYQQLIRLYITPILGTKELGRVDAMVLEQFYARLLKCRELCTGPRRGHQCRPLAPNTVRKVHFIMRATFECAVRWRYLGVNEAAMARPPAFKSSDPDGPTAEEAAALLNEASRDPDWVLFLWLTMTSGWRRGEACALRWTDVDLALGTVTIERSLHESTEKTTKTGQRRRVALDPVGVQMLTAHRERAAAQCQKIETTLDADAFIFSDAPDYRAPLRPHSVTQRYRRLAERVGLRSPRLHALRHYSASELVSAGVDIRTVAGRLGHGSGGATTLKVYAAWSAEADRRAAEAISGIVPRPDPSKRVPRAPYELVAAELRADILEGRLAPGEYLPTLVEVAAAHQISTVTANRAVALLRDEGLVDVARGRRTVVVGKPRLAVVNE